MLDKLAHYPGMYLAISFAVGVAIAELLDIHISALLGMMVITLLVLLIHRQTNLAIFYLTFVFLLIGSIRYQTWKTDHLHHPVEKLFPIDSISLTAEVRIPVSSQCDLFTVYVEKLIIEADTLMVDRRFVLKFDSLPVRLYPGDLLFLQGVTIDHLSGPRNPGQYDVKSHLLKKGILGRILLQTYSTVQACRSQKKLPFEKWLFLIRERIDQHIRNLCRGNAGHFLSGILLGKKAGIDYQIKRDFQKSGVAHVLAISGLHVGFMVLFVHFLVSFLPFSFRIQNVITLFILGIYMLLSGANPPVIRATLMVAIYLFGQILERKPISYNTLGIAAFIILIFQPQQLFWVGFQFSFVAVFSIFYFYERLKFLEDMIKLRFVSNDVSKKLTKIIVTPFLISLSAQLGTIPLMGYYFQNIPLISIFLNVLVIPLIGFIVALGVLMLFVSILYFEFALVVASFLSKVIQVLIEIVHFTAQLPSAYVEIPSFDVIHTLFYLLFLTVFLAWTKDQFRPVKLPVICLTIMIFFWILAPQKKIPQLLMLDVGQGDASLLVTSSGQQLLFDAGPVYPNWDSGERVIYPALQVLENLRLNKVFISHPHADHIGGLFYLLDEVEIDTVYLPDIKISYFWQDSLLNKLQEGKTPCRLLRLGDRVMVDHETQIYVLAPFSDFTQPTENTGEAINNLSLVSIVRMKNTSLLFTGDAEMIVEKRLLNWANFLKVDILKLGHHGSNTSSSLEFLQHVSPEFALISVGENNKFGHPSQEVLKRLQSLNIPYYRTDQDGAIWMAYRNSSWGLVNWRK
jgi:competence protein ComEC